MDRRVGHTPETDVTATFNGSWDRFSDPPAVYFEGRYKRTYCGWIDNFGNLYVAYYDHTTHELRSSIICRDPDANGYRHLSVLSDEHGRLFLFISQSKGSSVFFTRSLDSEDIDRWEEIRPLAISDKAHGQSNCFVYAAPVKSSAEEDRLYLFLLGTDGRLSYLFSDDKGENWSDGKTFFTTGNYADNDYLLVKLYSDEIGRIHFALANRKFANDTNNFIYYLYYQHESFFNINGEKISGIDDLLASPIKTGIVCDTQSDSDKYLIWDISLNEAKMPVIAYGKLSNKASQVYCYTTWNGCKWQKYSLINSGECNLPHEKALLKSYCEGGMSIDHENPGVLYLSVNRDSIFEIEKWITENKGKSWKVKNITERSSRDNIRPVAVHNASNDSAVQVLWMKMNSAVKTCTCSDDSLLSFTSRFQTAIKLKTHTPFYRDPLEKEYIVNIMHRTADWQLTNPYPCVHPLDWHYGTFYLGIRALYEVTREDRYLNELVNIGRAFNWQPMNEIYHADRLNIIDTWAWLYKLIKDPVMIDKSKMVLDIHLARRFEKLTDIRYQNNIYRSEWWTWCDALFMAPPAFVKMWEVTGNRDYLNYMDSQWWKTSDYLYSQNDSLFYRDDRFFSMKSQNGEQVFWARGNGWVLAALARILSVLPADYPNRPRYEQQYREIAEKVLSLQSEDGLWRVSLLDPEYINIGESSSSSFFTYALAWGINSGILDKKHRNLIEQAWCALCKNVNKDGKLGYVQQVAGSPQPFREQDWQVYATGAFLMAGKEILRLENHIKTY